MTVTLSQEVLIEDTEPDMRNWIVCAELDLHTEHESEVRD